MPKYTQYTFLGGKIMGKLYVLLYLVCIKKIKHFIFFNKKRTCAHCKPIFGEEPAAGATKVEVSNQKR